MISFKNIFFEKLFQIASYFRDICKFYHPKNFIISCLNDKISFVKNIITKIYETL